VLSDEQVEALLSGQKTTSFKSRDEQEVAGCAEAMDLVFEAYADLRLTENHVRQLHQTLLKHSTKDARHRGSYKSLSNSVVAIDADGREIGVVFVVTFLAIHPFQDGNGRLSRILTTLLLLRAGYHCVPYASLERVIEDNKDFYYKALRRTQKTLPTDTPDWEPWIGFFLRCLKKQKDNLVRRLEIAPTDAKVADADLPELALQIIAQLRRHERQTISQLTEGTKANNNTIKVRLRELVASGRVRQHGKARATWYTLATCAG
jgi:fido (protein-threonine AMPylation protein)